jgi:hypothetical protein
MCILFSVSFHVIILNTVRRNCNISQKQHLHNSNLIFSIKFIFTSEGKFFPTTAQTIFANLHVRDVYSKNDTQTVKVSLIF